MTLRVQVNCLENINFNQGLNEHNPLSINNIKKSIKKHEYCVNKQGLPNQEKINYRLITDSKIYYNRQFNINSCRRVTMNVIYSIILYEACYFSLNEQKELFIVLIETIYMQENSV